MYRILCERLVFYFFIFFCRTESYEFDNRSPEQCNLLDSDPESSGATPKKRKSVESNQGESDSHLNRPSKKKATQQRNMNLKCFIVLF